LLRGIQQRGRDVEASERKFHVGVRLPHFADGAVARRGDLILRGTTRRFGQLDPAPARSALGIDVVLADRNGAQRQRDAIDNGMSIEEAYAAEVAVTQHTYAREGVAT